MFFDSVANGLRSLAARAGHRKAKREEDEWMRNYKPEYSPSDHARMMKKIGKGDPVAMYMLADRYERALGLERNLAKAYYWLLRARARVYAAGTRRKTSPSPRTISTA
jgi:TPR repeat protein